MAAQVEVPDVKRMLLEADPALWSRLAERTRAATGFADLLVLSSLRKKAQQRGVVREAIAEAPLRLALVGGYSLYPLSELLEHCLDMAGTPIALYAGDYDNYTSELSDPASELHAFAPQVVCILPSPRLAQSSRTLLDSRTAIEAEARGIVDHLLGLCAAAHERSRCEIVLANFPLPGRHDLGAFRGRTLASDWSFRKLVNLELGLRAPAYVRVWDVEFITNRRGALNAVDDRAWFESKQPGSPDLLVDLARELVNVVTTLRRPPKKVLVLDLDNTLWGGVVGDDGLEGIEIGDTSPRGEAFKAFQRNVKALKERGVLLAVCSKNDHARAVEPFEKHPEMVLRMDDFAAFYANWEPKGNNIRRMAAELNLGLDSFVFVDDNAAEIENVRQFAPDVTGIHLGADPAEYVAILQDCRLFEPSNITADDAERTGKYKVELERKQLLASSADMDAYLASLEMEGTISALVPVDVPRVSQLINKSNQFNLTTRRRTEAEVAALIEAPGYACFSVRLKDRFGDHGLIGVGIGRVEGVEMVIDTWLMSCRVLKRQVEDEVLNEFARLAAAKGCSQLRGVYRPTPKNDMVREHYPQLGFRVATTTPEQSEFSLDLMTFNPRPTHIRVSRAV
jgi:FkbH-like protein